MVTDLLKGRRDSWAECVERVEMIDGYDITYNYRKANEQVREKEGGEMIGSLYEIFEIEGGGTSARKEGGIIEQEVPGMPKK